MKLADTKTDDGVCVGENATDTYPIDAAFDNYLIGNSFCDTGKRALRKLRFLYSQLLWVFLVLGLRGINALLLVKDVFHNKVGILNSVGSCNKFLPVNWHTRIIILVHIIVDEEI